MKKIIMLFVTACMVFSLSACGSEKSDASREAEFERRMEEKYGSTTEDEEMESDTEATSKPDTNKLDDLSNKFREVLSEQSSIPATNSSESYTSANSTSGMTKSGNTTSGSNSSTQAARSLCPYCEGVGDCRYCDGLGDCKYCNGDGYLVCTVCQGSGRCQSCYGTCGEYKYVFGGDNKWVDCTHCRGTGECSRCHGERYSDCNHCVDGNCNYCKGTRDCQYCVDGYQ